MTTLERREAVTSPRTRGVFPSLDGLRIVAVTAVVATHTAFTTGRYQSGWGRDVLAHLDVGVAVFFVISGFLLSREWLVRDRETGGMPRLGGYALRRVLRIVPLYWVTVVIGFLALDANRDRGVSDWLRHLFLLQIYGGGHLVDGLTQTWSLATEISFYAVLPGIAWVIVRCAGQRERIPLVAAVTGAVLLLASLVWTVWFHVHFAPWLDSAGYWLPTTLGWFTAGTALAAIRIGADDPSARLHRLWRRLDGIGDSPGVWLLVSGCALAAAVTPMTGSIADPFPGASPAVTKNVLYLIVALGLVIPAVLGSTRGTDAVLGHPVMRWLGRISYGVFLLHLLVLRAVTNLLGLSLGNGSFVLVMALTWTASVAVAAVAYRVIERPALRFAHRGRS